VFVCVYQQPSWDEAYVGSLFASQGKCARTPRNATQASARRIPGKGGDRGRLFLQLIWIRGGSRPAYEQSTLLPSAIQFVRFGWGQGSGVGRDKLGCRGALCLGAVTYPPTWTTQAPAQMENNTPHPTNRVGGRGRGGGEAHPRQGNARRTRNEYAQAHGAFVGVHALSLVCVWR
jgi:hypothetical protein